jgi:hypothetical protein
MSRIVNMRHSAHQCLQRAKEFMARNDEASARHACLELRFCIEYITYDQLQTYLKEVPDDTVIKWTPKQIISALLEVDPHADKSATIAIGVEETYGVPAKEMRLLGEDRRFSLKWANSRHSLPDSFLSHCRMVV